MKDTVYCLCCGKSLAQNGEKSQWHSACSRRFFGTEAIPELDLSSATLEEYARLAINAGNTVTGVQKKMSLHLQNDEGRKRLTLIGYPSGYILKPPVIDYPDLPELEHSLMCFADAAGIRTVPNALIRMASNENAYITRRIDRPIKIAMEDFCQLSQRLTEDKYKGSYEQCGKIIARYSSRPGLDMADFFFLLLFSFVTGNADMHLKNFSLIESPTGYILAPAYDLVPTQLLIPEDTEETALTVNGKKNRLTVNDFQILGNNLGLVPKVIHNLFEKTASLPRVLIDSTALNFLPPNRAKELTELIDKRCGMFS